MDWRRISDWKHTIALVQESEVPPGLCRDLQLVRPAERVQAEAPRLAEWARTTGLVRVEGGLVETLRRAGVTVWEVGYHRGSDGMRLAWGGGSRDLDMGALLAVLLGDSADDDERFDRWRDDQVDAVLRIFSEGALTERAVLVAALLPPLAPGPVELDPSLPQFEAEGGTGLPEVSGEFVNQVAAALEKLQATPRPPPGPQLSPEARRRYIWQSAIVGGLGLAVALGALPWTPWVAVLALPVVVVCGLAIAIHARVLWQQRGRG